MAGEFQIKPLSTGIGIGSVLSRRQPLRERLPEHQFPVESSSSGLSSLPHQPVTDHNPTPVKTTRFDIPIQQEPSSVAVRAIYEKSQNNYTSETDQRSKKSFIKRFLRFAFGAAFDAVFVMLALIVITFFGMFMWQLGVGAEDSSNPINIVSQVVKLAVTVGPLVIALVYVVFLSLYVIVSKFIVGSSR